MRMILLDTHVLAWVALDPKRLSKKAHAAIREARMTAGIAVASISLWELAWLAEHGRIQVSGTVTQFVREMAAKVTVLPITADIAAQAVRLPTSYPKDPADRLIASTALVEGLPLVTADERIRGANIVAAIW